MSVKMRFTVEESMYQFSLWKREMIGASIDEPNEFRNKGAREEVDLFLRKDGWVETKPFPFAMRTVMQFHVTCPNDHLYKIAMTGTRIIFTQSVDWTGTPFFHAKCHGKTFEAGSCCSLRVEFHKDDVDGVDSVWCFFSKKGS